MYFLNVVSPKLFFVVVAFYWCSKFNWYEPTKTTRWRYITTFFDVFFSKCIIVWTRPYFQIYRCCRNSEKRKGYFELSFPLQKSKMMICVWKVCHPIYYERWEQRKRTTKNYTRDNLDITLETHELLTLAKCFLSSL